MALSASNGDGGNEVFAQDGLLYKGEITYSEDGCWGREPGNEEELWRNAPKRVLFLTKDLREKEPWDVRNETGRKNKFGKDAIKITTPFYKVYMKSLFCILNPDKVDRIDDLEMDVFRSFFDATPIVRVNCKKQIGGGSLSLHLLESYLNKYQEMLVRQIEIYDADIIFCAGGSSKIKDFVQKNYLTDIKQVNDWVWYSETKNKVVIDSYHFSLRGKFPLHDLIKAYLDFLAKYPSFSTSNR